MAKSIFDMILEDKQNSQEHRFGPDYYAKLASSPSGTKAKSPKSPEIKILPWPPQQPESEEQFNSSSPVQEKKYENQISKTYIAAEEERDIHRAKPIIIENTNDLLTIETQELPIYSSHTHPYKQKSIEEIKAEYNQNMPETEREGSLEYVAEITSDSDLSYINCYDVGNSQVYKKSTETEPQMPKTGFTKNAKTHNYQRTIMKRSEPTTLKRYKSESDLIVLPQKKDNTLISKIYKVLSKSDLSEYPSFRTQLSAPDAAGYNHDNELIRNKTDYSSHEVPLSSIDSNKMTITKHLSLSSEDDNSDLCSFYSEYRPIKNAFSSNEDLLSMDDTDRSRKKDNTIISKIYKQQNVRNYALNKKQQTPEREPNNDNTSIKKILPRSENYDHLEETDYGNAINGRIVTKTENELEVNELAKKRIVHNILDQLTHSKTQSETNQLSKHYTNGKSKKDINEESKNDVNEESKKDIIEESNKDINDESKESDEDGITTSVKDLMKKFENNVGKNQVVSSLTARSLSRHTRKQLRD